MAKVYECIEFDVTTKNCKNWQEVVKQDPNELPITKQEMGYLTEHIILFFAFVWVLNQIKKSLR